jgi:glycosyltransferase involved in cell wall biosynthesis
MGSLTTNRGERPLHPFTEDPTGHEPRPRRLRVLFVETNADGTVGGSHQALYDLVRTLDRSRYEPVLLFYQGNRFADILSAEGEEVIVWEEVNARERLSQSTGSAPARLRAVADAILRRRRLLKERRIDLVHLNNTPQVGLDDWLPAAKLGRRSIVSAAMGGASGVPGTGFLAAVRRTLMKRYDRVIPVSRYILEALREHGVPESGMTLVHHGIDVEAFRRRVTKTPSATRAALGVPDDVIFAVMVGNVRHWKGQHVVVDALSLLPRDVLNSMHFLFVGATAAGDRDYHASLLERCQAAGLGEHVRLVGPSTEVPNVLAAADIAVHASVIPEPGGIVVLEAMASQAAVVAADKGGHTTYLVPDAGLLHDVDDPTDLARHISQLVRDGGTRRAMIARAYERVREYNLVRNARETEVIYEQLLGANRSRHPQIRGRHR